MIGFTPTLEFFLRLITISAVILTAWIGIHGLRHEFRTADGQLTPAGRRARALMAGLAVLSVLSEVTRFVVDSDKERSAANEATTRFETQMSRLDEVTQTLSGISRTSSEVESGLRSSLEAQTDLLNLTDQNLRLSREVGRQGRRNTEDVLQRIFEDSNRVHPERLTLAVQNSCSRDNPGPITNPLIGSTVVARVKVRRPRSMTSAGIAQFDSLERQNHEGTLVGHMPAGGGFTTTSVFSGFSGEISGLELMEAWRGAMISVEIIAIRRSLTVEQAISQFNSTPSPANSQKCRPNMRFFLNSRLVAVAQGEEQRFDPLAARFVLRFDDVAIQNSQIPRFVPYVR